VLELFTKKCKYRLYYYINFSSDKINQDQTNENPFFNCLQADHTRHSRSRRARIRSTDRANYGAIDDLAE